MPTVLVTGASRGLGLEFARQYVADAWRVHACAREPEAADELQALAEDAGGRVALHRLDVADFERIDELGRELRGETLDVLVNNAGDFGRDAWGLGDLDYTAWERVLRVNTLAPVRMTEALLGSLPSGAKLAMVTSKMGSIADNTSGGSYAYRSSKAALNAAVKSLALDLAPRGIAACVLHPGWVRTRMGGEGAPLEPSESVAGMRKVIAGLGAAESGRFWNWDGVELPW